MEGVGRRGGGGGGESTALPIMGKYLSHMNKFCDWLSGTKVISVHESCF